MITWHHVAFTFTTGVVKGFIDGAPVGFLANTFTGTETLAQWMYGLFLATGASRTNSFIGNLDDVRIYNRALSGTEVSGFTRHSLKKLVVRRLAIPGRPIPPGFGRPVFLPETAPN